MKTRVFSLLLLFLLAGVGCVQATDSKEENDAQKNLLSDPADLAQDWPTWMKESRALLKKTHETYLKSKKAPIEEQWDLTKKVGAMVKMLNNLYDQGDRISKHLTGSELAKFNAELEKMKNDIQNEVGTSWY